MKNTKIEWTDNTINPLYFHSEKLSKNGNPYKAFKCEKISPACQFCYAEEIGKRFKTLSKNGKLLDYTHKTTPEIGKTYVDISGIIKAKPGSKNFVCSMTDIFGHWWPKEHIQVILDACLENNQAIFQILTKRVTFAKAEIHTFLDRHDLEKLPANIWIGATVENREQSFRIYQLTEIPATVRFMSIEPILSSLKGIEFPGIHWVIVGGESGRNHRKPNPQWIREVRNYCFKKEIPFFFKQWGGNTPKANGNLLDGKQYMEWPKNLSC